MFRRARVRLTLQYIGLFALVLALFSAVLYAVFASVLSPVFDLTPEITDAQSAQAAYGQALRGILIAIVAADAAALVLIGLAGWVLAARTLRPIRDAHRRQRRFIADASHELRSPVAAIRARAEAALAVGASDGELRTALADVARRSGELATLADDLLLLARAEGGPADDELDEADLSVVVAEAVEAFAAAHPGVRAPRIRLAPGLSVRARPGELGRIVDNLVDNAFRYGGPDVAVRVTTAAEGSAATLVVSDDGPGIGAADAAHVFEAFYRVHSDEGAPAGTGLGLAIARSLAERNGGRLTVESRPGAGATFRLALPRFT